MARMIPSLTAAMFLTFGLPAWAADDSDPQIAPCLDAVGTYLTNRIIDVDGDFDIVMRSLVSLTNGGHIFFTNVVQGGLTYQPFSDGQGAWRCDGNTDGTIRLTALILDFVYPTKDDPKARISRLDVTAEIVAATGDLSGNGTISFVSIAGDPYDKGALTNPIEFAFTGAKVAVDN